MPKDIKSNSPLPVFSGYPVLRCFKRDFVFFSCIFRMLNGFYGTGMNVRKF